VLRFLVATAALLSISASAIAQSANLSIVKTADPEPVVAGTTLTYTLTLSNEGPNDAATVAVTDPLPAGVTFQSLSAPGGWSCTAPAVGTNGTVNCTIALFPVGSAVFTIAGTVGAGVSNGTILSNTATVTSATPDPQPGNESSTANSTVSGPPPPTVSVTKNGAPNPTIAGNNITYTIVVTNSGGVDLEAAAISDTLPAPTTFVSLAVPAGWSCTQPAPGAGGTVACSSTAVPAASSATFTLVAHVPAATPPGSVSNTVVLTSSAGGRDNPPTSATATTQITTAADVSVTSLTDAPDPVAAGSNLVYTIGVANAGPSNAPNASLTDTLPPGTTFVSITAPAGWSCAPGTASCTNPSFAPGSGTFTLTVSTSAAIPGGTVLTDTATIASSADSTPGNNSATTTTTVKQPTTTTITTPPTSIPATQPFTVNFTVSGTGTPTGSVTVSDGQGASCTATLPASGCSITFATVGSHTVTAAYSGSASFFPSTSPPVTFNVVPATQIPTLGRVWLLLLALVLGAVALAAARPPG
jgi:uncharacterized repeat protein (TIGR01451 family)